jgi:hypothetical protein
VIGVYERHFAPGRQFVEKSKDKIAQFYHTLPRQLRSVPLLEALMRNNGTNLMGAIFEIDLPSDEMGNLFPEETNSFDLSRRTSRMSVTAADRNLEVPQSPTSFTRRRSRTPSRRGVSRPPPVNATSLAVAASTPAPPADQDPPVQHDIYDSPLTRLFSRRSMVPKHSDANMGWEEAIGSFKRVETLLEAAKEMPVGKLREDIKELQVRPFVDFGACHGVEQSNDP